MTEASATADSLGSFYVPVSGKKTVGQRVRAFFSFCRRNKLGAVGMFIVAVCMVFAIFSPLLQRYDDSESFQTKNPDFNPTANPIDIAANPDKALGSPFILDRWERPLSAKHPSRAGERRRRVPRRLLGHKCLAASAQSERIHQSTLVGLQPVPRFGQF